MDCYKTLSNHIRIQKNALKNRRLIARGDHRKNIKVIKVSCVKCETVNGIICNDSLKKEVVIAHKNSSFLVRHGDHY